MHHAYQPLVYTLLLMFLSGVPGTVAAIDTEPAKTAMPSPAAVLKKQKDRIQSILAMSKLPFIDMESTLTVDKMQREFPDALAVMDELGIAQIAFEGDQAPKSRTAGKGYRWSFHTVALNQQFPAYFFMTANGGNNPNWAKQKLGSNSYISQLNTAIRSGAYRLMGELEFRHYMSSAQCKQNRTDRDVNVPIDSENGHRVFKLAQDTGVPFVIHYEPEDSLIPALENMLSTYPRARVIWAHFGQLRKPALMTGFTAARVRQLLTDHPNLYFELSTGEPNRKYHCASGSYQEFGVLDTVIWQESRPGLQADSLKDEYRQILTEFSGRFVSGADYGGNRPPFGAHFRARIKNMRLILRDLPPDVVHRIAYRNAWYLLTGQAWRD